LIIGERLAAQRPDAVRADPTYQPMTLRSQYVSITQISGSRAISIIVQTSGQTA
jgi:hypothetical protein